jgi:hypothetical protein
LHRQSYRLRRRKTAKLADGQTPTLEASDDAALLQSFGSASSDRPAESVSSERTVSSDNDGVQIGHLNLTPERRFSRNPVVRSAPPHGTQGNSGSASMARRLAP